MKISIFFFALILSVASFAQGTDAELVAGPQITFTENTFDFGEINQGDKVEHVFEYKNTGTAPLVIANVRTTCGCTASNYNSDPIAPGELGSILVKFNSTGKIGIQNKVVTIMSNAVNNPERVKIVANILRPQPVEVQEEG